MPAGLHRKTGVSKVQREIIQHDSTSQDTLSAAHKRGLRDFYSNLKTSGADSHKDIFGQRKTGIDDLDLTNA